MNIEKLLHISSFNEAFQTNFIGKDEDANANPITSHFATFGDPSPLRITFHHLPRVYLGLRTLLISIINGN